MAWAHGGLMARRHTRDSVVEMLVTEGAQHAIAEEIADTLCEGGLSWAGARRWLAHPDLAYPIRAGDMRIDGETYPRYRTAIFLIEDGEAETVRRAAVAFASAADDERRVAILFGSDIEQARQLTGADEIRMRV